MDDSPFTEYVADHVIRPGGPDPTREPLLLVHGLGHCKEAWDPVLPILAAHFDVVAVDLPGFGGAPALSTRAPGLDQARPDQPPADEALVDWLEELMEHLGWATAHVAGNSLGGLLAIRLGGRGRARTVTAFSPGGMAQGWENRWVSAFLAMVRTLAPLLGRLAPFSTTVMGRRIALAAIFGRPERMTPGYARMSMLAPGIATAFDEVLAAVMQPQPVRPVAAPVTIAWGTRDLLLFPRQGVRWVNALPGARLVALRGLGHTPMPDDPQVVADVIVATAAQAAAEDVSSGT